MFYERKIITPVSTEPVTLTEAKLHLRVTESAEDTLITALIAAAREFCENVTGRALATQTLELLLDNFPAETFIEIPMPPLQSIASIKYKDYAAVETTLGISDYIVDADRSVGRVTLAYGKSWPTFTPYPSNPIRVRFTAGYTSIPKAIKQAMLLLIGHWYANRESVLVGSVSKQIELAVDALLSQYRVRWFG
jgi:uncharacterized phiE125 gp8 family phage protein